MGLPSPQQIEALAELRAIQDALANPGSLKVWPFGAPAAEGWPGLDWPAELDDDWLVVDLQLAVPGQDRHPGSPVGPTERVRVLLSPHYPHVCPLAWGVPPGHLGGLPHVLWDGDLCLYESPTDWDPADGMPGFLTRLESWYEHAAAGTLDPVDQPAHPPLAAGARSVGQLVVLADAPRLTGTGPLVCTAVLAYRSPGHADVVGWLDRLPSADELDDALDDVLQDTPDPDSPSYLAAAVLLSTPMTFTFPDTKGELVGALVARGVNVHLNDHIRRVEELNGLLAQPRNGAWPAYLLIGSPADRTPGRSHLAAWRLDGRAEPDTVSWAVVYDQREEMIVRRDAESPLSWLRGKAVLVLGCGALGAPIAEQCLRAGAGALLLVDNGRVSPGVLVRQPYRDADIGAPKAYALADRLQAIRPETNVASSYGDVLSFSDAAEELWGVDLVVDATANPSVATFLERHRWNRAGRRPAILTVAVGHRSRRGIALLAPPSASGAGWDLLNRLALTAGSSRALADVADDFFPNTEQNRFRPEPGCSQPTFVGSATEVQAIGAQLFEWGVRRLSRVAAQDADTDSMAGYVVRLSGELPAVNAELLWSGDLVVAERPDGYQIRLAAEAVALFRAEVEAAAGSGVETGGLLIGRVDSAAMVVWVTAALGRPAGSVQARDWLYLPSQDTGQLSRLVRRMTRQRARVLGMWHTHPHGRPEESATDRFMAAQLAALPDGPRRTLLLTLGSDPDPLPDWLAGQGRPSISARLVSRAPEPAGPDRSAPVLVEHRIDVAAAVDAVWSAFIDLGVVPETGVRARTDPNRIFWETTAPDGTQLCEWLFIPITLGTRVLATESLTGAPVDADRADLQQHIDNTIRELLGRLRSAVEAATG
jgi:proteasome lid subunit RPN8/RPN11